MSPHVGPPPRNGSGRGSRTRSIRPLRGSAIWHGRSGGLSSTGTCGGQCSAARRRQRHLPGCAISIPCFCCALPMSAKSRLSSNWTQTGRTSRSPATTARPNARSRRHSRPGRSPAATSPARHRPVWPAPAMDRQRPITSGGTRTAVSASRQSGACGGDRGAGRARHVCNARLLRVLIAARPGKTVEGRAGRVRWCLRGGLRPLVAAVEFVALEVGDPSFGSAEVHLDRAGVVLDVERLVGPGRARPGRRTVSPAHRVDHERLARLEPVVAPYHSSTTSSGSVLLL
jgi:hypothetical protein